MKKENNYYLRNMTLFEKEKEERKIKMRIVISDFINS